LHEIVAVIAVAVLFGAKRLPEIARSSPGRIQERYPRWAHRGSDRGAGAGGAGSGKLV